MGPIHNLTLCIAKQLDYHQNHLSLWVPALICGFCMQKSDFWTRSTSLNGSQTQPVVLCMQNSVISTWITSLYGFQPSFVFFACKTATFGSELQVCKEPRPHLSLCACKTAWLASELLVSVGPSPHLWLLDTKQRLLDQNNKSPLDSDIIYRFVHAKQRD